MSWPNPGDSPVARARRVAQAYRADLEAYAPARCAQMDSLMRKWGQLWVVPRLLTVDADTLVSAAEAADLAAISMAALRNLRRAGRITGYPAGRNRWMYLAGDVLALTTQPRRRPRAACTPGDQ